MKEDSIDGSGSERASEAGDGSVYEPTEEETQQAAQEEEEDQQSNSSEDVPLQDIIGTASTTCGAAQEEAAQEETTEAPIDDEAEPEDEEMRVSPSKGYLDVMQEADVMQLLTNCIESDAYIADDNPKYGDIKQHFKSFIHPEQYNLLKEPQVKQLIHDCWNKIVEQLSVATKVEHSGSSSNEPVMPKGWH